MVRHEFRFLSKTIPAYFTSSPNLLPHTHTTVGYRRGFEKRTNCAGPNWIFWSAYTSFHSWLQVKTDTHHLQRHSICIVQLRNNRRPPSTTNASRQPLKSPRQSYINYTMQPNIELRLIYEFNYRAPLISLIKDVLDHFPSSSLPQWCRAFQVWRVLFRVSTCSWMSYTVPWCSLSLIIEFVV